MATVFREFLSLKNNFSKIPLKKFGDKKYHSIFALQLRQGV